MKKVDFLLISAKAAVLSFSVSSTAALIPSISSYFGKGPRGGCLGR
jgi:hypothetical protein